MHVKYDIYACNTFVGHPLKYNLLILNYTGMNKRVANRPNTNTLSNSTCEPLYATCII